MQSRQMQGPGVQQPRTKQGVGVPPSPPSNPPHSWPLAIAQAETEKLEMRGISLVVQGVARDRALVTRPGQIIV